MVAVVLTIVSSALAKYSGGTGEPNDPYQIATAADLIALGEEPNDYDKHFILTADIDFSDYPADQYNCISSFSGVFDGNGHTISNFTSIGEGHDAALFSYVRDPNAVIKNLGLVDPNVQATTGGAGGLVGDLWEGCVQDCYVSGGRILGNYNVGGLVGYSRSTGKIIGCYSTAVVSGGSVVGGLVGVNGGTVWNCYSVAVVSCDGWGAGGLVGRNGASLATGVQPGRIRNCYAGGAVQGNSSVGGLVGYNEYSFVTDCYSTADVTGSSEVGGLVGQQNLASIVRSYAVGRVTGDERAGGLVCLPWTANTGGGTTRTGGGSVESEERNTVVGSFWDTETSGLSVSGGGTGVTTKEMQDPQTFVAAGWHFAGMLDGPSDIWAQPAGEGYPILWWQLPELPERPVFSGGNGDPCHPYLIATASDLNSIGYNPRLMTSHFKLTSDIDLAGTWFHPIGDGDYPYSGAFDGGGFRIHNLTLASSGTPCLGLFACIEGREAQVKDLNLTDPCIVAEDEDFVGAMAGRLRSGFLTNCSASNVDVRGGECVGGLVGGSAGTITRCSSVGGVVGDRFVGGLLGMNESLGYDNRGSVSYCCSAGAVSGTRTCTGGLVGDSALGDLGCSYSRCDVTGQAAVGGLVGHLEYRNAVACYSTGSVTGNSYVGGLVGLGPEKASRSFWDTETSGQADDGSGMGKTTADMQMAATFLEAGWDFEDETANGTDDIWWIEEGQDYPRLWWEPRPAVRLPVIDLDATTFDAGIAEGVVLVDFFATWCSHCTTQAPILEEVADRLEGEAQVAKLDIDKARSILQRYGVTAVPTLILFRDGVEIKRFIGVTSADVLVAAILAAVELEQ